MEEKELAYLLFIAGFLGLIGGVVKLIIDLIKKKPKKQSAVIGVVSLVGLVTGALLADPVASLSIDETELTTNANGVAVIEGKTNTDAILTIDGIEIAHEDGVFSHAIELSDIASEEVIVKAVLEESEAEEIITISPSEAFVAFVNEEKAEEERVKKVESALALAEKNPSQENYDEAATLIESLSKEYDGIGKRLETVNKSVEAEKAIAIAEKELTQNSLKNAEILVAAVSLNKSDFTERLTMLQKNVQEREALYKGAEEAVALAESDPSDDSYKKANDLVEALPAKKDTYQKRIAVVKETIQKNKEAEAKRIAEEERLAEEKRIADQKAAEEAAAQELAREAAAVAAAQSQAVEEEHNHAEVGETVLVTRTGSKYHRRKCGNGTYTPDTLENAVARGLEPCSKCY